MNIANAFSRFLDTERIPSRESVLNPERSFPAVKNVFLESNRLPVLSLEQMEAPLPSEARIDEIELDRNRATLLRVISVLSILLRYRHNRRITSYYLGPKFAVEIVGMVKFFSNKIEDLCLSWKSISFSSTHLDEIISAGLLDDTAFVIRSLLLLVQLLVGCCPNVEEMSSFADTKFLPPQPWNKEDLESLGFNMFQINYAESQQEKTFSFEISATDPAILSSMKPIQVCMTYEPWAQYLFNAGVVIGMTELLRRITQFVRVFSLCDKELIEWDIVICSQLQECKVLQNEILFSLLSLATLNPEEFCPHFMSCEGAKSLNLGLLQFDSPRSCRPLGSHLCYQTGVLCLRLTEILNQYLTNSISDQKYRKTVLEEDAICSFLRWIPQAFPPDEDFLEQIARSQSTHAPASVDLEEVVVAAVQLFDIPVSDHFESDLWPWDVYPEQHPSNMSIKLTHRPVSMNYRLCHPCSEQFQIDFSTKSPNRDWPNLLKVWSSFLDQILEISETPKPQTTRFPWFLLGKPALSLHLVFDILFSTCLGKCKSFFAEANHSSDIKRNHISSNIFVVMKTVLSVLEKRNFDNSREKIPLFEVHFLLFLARCLHCAPVHTIEACCEAPEIWSTIFSSKLFLGGRNEIQNLFDLNLRWNQPSESRDTLETLGKDSLLDPILRCRSFQNTTDSTFARETFIGMTGYSWVCVHEFSLDLASMITSIVNHPPVNRIVSIKRNFDIKPIIHALQESSENGDDSVTFQLLKWMSGYLDLLSARGSSIRNALSGQFFRAALAVCGYHLGDIRASAILQKEHTHDPIILANKTRPFMWASRRAAIELVIQVLGYSGCDRWLRLFSSVKIEKNPPGDSYEFADSRGAVPLAKQTKSPAHVTLMLLFIDVRLRTALSFILSKVLFKLMTEGSQQVDDNHLKPRESVSNLDTSPDSKVLSTANDSKNKYSKCICDLLIDLFELIKWSSRQPEWYNGSQVAIAILRSLTGMVRSQRAHASSMTKDLQRWFRKGGILLEFIACLNSCLLHADKWTEKTRVEILHNGLAFLTAIMSGDANNKLEFRMVLMSKRSSRSLSPSKIPAHSSPKLKKSSQVGIRFDDFIEMIIRTQSHVSLDTFLILFEMLLDGPISNSKLCSLNFQESPQQIPLAQLFPDHIDRPQIFNFSVIPIIFGVMNQSPPAIQDFVLNSFHSLISGRASLINISNCSQMNPSMLDLVLDHFPSQTEEVQLVSVKLIQSLGKHSITVAQLKRIFQMMRTHGDFRAAYSTLLLKGLQGMVDENERPRHSFVFDGVDSGIEIPSISRWPSLSAFTISLWIRIESPHTQQQDRHLFGSKNSTESEYRPFVLSMRCRNGHGFDISLRQSTSASTKFRVCVRSYGGSIDGDSFLLPVKLPVIEGQWHYLAVTMKSSSFRNHSEIEVMLDDQFVRHKLSFPKFNDVIERPLLGGCIESFRETKVNTTLRGQMSAFYLFADALTEGQLRGIYGLGPSYFYSFESYSVVHREITPPASRKQTVDPVLSVLDGSLSALIVLAYNPAVWKGDFCLDNTPERNQMRWKLPPSNSDFIEKDQQPPLPSHNPGKMNARILPGTYRSTTSDIRTALNSLGGVRVLLPLFAQFDQPRIQTPREMKPFPPASDLKVINAVDTDLSVTLFDLLRCFFVRTSENESLLRDFQGFALVGFFLERISPQHLSLHTLDLILKIRDSVSWNPTFSDDVLEYLLLNFKIWKFASFDVQKRLFAEIDTILSSVDAKVIQTRNFTTKLIDALYLLYDYENPSLEVIHVAKEFVLGEDFVPRSSDSTVGSTTAGDIFFHAESAESIYLADQWIHASSGLVEGVKLKGSQLKVIRSALLRILTQLISRGNGDGVVLPDDIAYLVRSTLLTSNSSSKAEILSLLVFFLSDDNTSRNPSLPQVLLGLVASKGLLALLPLVSDSNKQVRFLTLLLFCLCLRQGSLFGNLSHHFGQPIKSDATNDVFESECPTSEDPPPMQDTQTEHHTIEESLDTFAMLGLPISCLIGITHHLQGEIMKYLNLEEDTDLVNFQAQILLQSLTLTLLGESCSHLMISVLKLDPLGLKQEEDVGSFFPFSKVAQLDREEKREDFHEPTICIPMVLPAILAVLKQKRISIATRLSTMVDLRTYILHSNENCDHVLRIPAWQDYFFELIVEETSNLEQLEQGQPNESQSKYLIKSKALVDTSLRALCDIQFTAVRIGKPIVAPIIISPQSRRNSELTVDRIFKETKVGERQLGVTVLQETISFLRLYHRGELGGVDMYPIGFDLLQQTVSALQRESDILLSQRKVPEDGSNMRLYFQNMLFLNIWLVGAIVLEFLTFPLGTGTKRSPAESIDHIHFLLSSINLGQNESSLSLKQYEGSVWALVESLLRLMGPLGPMSDNQLLIRAGEKGLTANQVGYLTGQKSLSLVDERINEIVIKPIVSGNSPGRTSIAKQNTPLYQAAGGVCWIMVRVLFSVFAHGGIVENSMAISALLELKALLSFICDEHLDNFGFELNSIIGRLNAVLHITPLSIQSEWVKGALNLLIDLILIQRTHLLRLIMKAENISQSPSSRGKFKASDQTTVGLVIFVQLLEKYSRKPEHSFKISEVLVDAVRTCLCLPDNFNFTWEMWSALMTEVVDAADTKENELRREKLTDLGLHKHSEEVRIQLEQLRTLDLQVFHDVFCQAGLAHGHLRELEIRRLSEKLRSLSRSEKKIKLRWNQIVYQLVNERGPWGFPDGMEVYWKLDQTESNLRMTHVLRRNEVGTSHKVATQLVKRGKNEKTSNDFVLEDSPIESQRHQPGNRSAGSMNAYISPHGLWRDLMKYQKQSSTFADNQVDPSDRIELDEGDDEPRETDVKKILFRAAVEVISKSTNSAGGSTHGILELSKDRLSFTRTSEEGLNFINKSGNEEFLWACQHFPTTTWHTTEIWNVYFRKYQMRNVALELFFTSRQVVFFNLFDPANQRLFYDTIRRQCKPPYLQPHCGYRPSSIVANAMHQPSSRTMTQAWINRNISNFEYLMFLNTVAGRSFNDMSQYPVFPWVIADYSSPKLNFTDPKSFRDLRWPMGAQQESQREVFVQRYQDLAESYDSALGERKRNVDGNGPPLQSDCLPPFHYGSHYSTMGFVLWYLVREEPFTSLNIWMQDGRFDKPDRIFDTLESCWRGCTTNQADVKELIPEFFYNSDFLENTNRLDLGVTTNNKLLGPVGLPPWAKNAQDFIRQNRNALESEYVSANLHHWIDLIFGYKQRPPHMGGSDAAVEACNVYFHLTYSGAVDLDDLKLNDPRLYNQMVRQIDNYGQTPTELFHRPHPARKPLDEVDLFWPISSQVLGVDTLPKGAKLPERPRRMVCFKEHKISVWPVVFIGEINTWEKLITVDTARIVATHFWQLRPPDVVPPFQFKSDLSALKCSQGSLAGGFDMTSLMYTSNPKERRVGVPFAPEQLLQSDSNSDYSNRKITILANSKLIYEKEEAARSNWKMRSHAQSPTSLKQSPETKHISKKFEAKEPESEHLNLSQVDNPLVLTRVDEHIASHLFALLPDHRLLFSCGHWDNSFKVTLLDSGRLLQSISQHRDVVTCLDLVVDFGHIWLVTGSRDCTSIIWEINPSLEQPIIQPPMHVLYGHDDAVNCVSVNPELDLVVSGSDDGTIIVHKLREGIYIRSIALIPQPDHPSRSLGANSSPFPTRSNSHSLIRSFLSSRRIHFLLVSSEGFIVAYSYDDQSLYSFSINGKFQAKKMIADRIHAIRLSEDHKVIITGGERGLLVMRSVHSLELSNVGSKFEFESIIDGRSQDDNEQKPFASPIRSIYLTKQERHLIVGLENGEIRILTQVRVTLSSLRLASD
jgi:WD40 repeat protein